MPQRKKRNAERLRRMNISPSDAEIGRMQLAQQRVPFESEAAASPFGPKTLDLLAILAGKSEIGIPELLSILRGERSLGEVEPTLR